MGSDEMGSRPSGDLPKYTSIHWISDVVNVFDNSFVN